EQARTLSTVAPRHILRVAVMQHPPQALLDEVLATFAPDVLQTDAEDLARLSVPKEVSVTPVVRVGHAVPNPLPARLLFEGPVSGTGAVADWNRAAELASATQLILAGGLNVANVADAIARVRPYGVDVSSGVESAPGVKDVQKIREFVRLARSAMVPAPRVRSST
ncbi:MAG: phosphoribosylanthranilate isomerase, partial [Steroidobacteraceae bacterium]